MLINNNKKLLIILCLFFFNSICFSLPSESIYNLNSNIIDKHNNINSISSLQGKVQVFSMIYTNCKTICPIIIANMKAIEKLIPENELNNVNFTLVSLDPDRDTNDIISKFLKEKKMNEKRWNLFRMSKDDTLKLALTVGIKYKKEKNNEYTHSNLIIVLDKNGLIKMHHQGLDKNYDSVVKLISKLT